MFLDTSGLFLLFMVPVISMLVSVLSRQLYQLYYEPKIDKELQR